jgi:EAL domain-containing protein (putative c-di-GMP-specific phosphodiesterase class I)
VSERGVLSGGLEVLFERLELATLSARRARGAAVLAVKVHLPRSDEPPDENDWVPLEDEAIVRIRRCLRRVDSIATVGPVSFLVLLERAEEGPFAVHVADQIVDALRAPYLVDGRRIDLVASVGVSVFPDDGEDADQIVRGARAALDAALMGGGDLFGFSSSTTNEAAGRKLAIERALSSVLDRNELSLFFQPQVDTRDGSLAGAEALLRWKSPKLGDVSPAEFVPVLEASGAIDRVGEWVLGEACRHAARWAGEGRPVRVGVNVSAHQLRHDGFEVIVRRALESAGLEPSLLELELTETVLVENPTSTRAVIEKIRKLGVHVALDDFGTGYASLAYIRHFPMDALKIDRQFIRGLPIDTESAAITSAIVALARSLRLDVIAEGVETEAEEEFLHSQACTIVQGYRHAHPMSVEAFEEWRRKRPWA